MINFDIHVRVVWTPLVHKLWSRANPLRLIHQTELNKNNVGFCPRSLRNAGWIERVVRGLYEFVEDSVRAKTMPKFRCRACGETFATEAAAQDHFMNVAPEHFFEEIDDD